VKIKSSFIKGELFFTEVITNLEYLKESRCVILRTIDENGMMIAE